MHESVIAQSLLEIIEEEAGRHGGTKVTRVKVLIGKLSGVVPEALRFAFEAITTDSIAEGALLEIEEVPLRIRCNQCRKTHVIDGPFIICPDCEGADVKMVTGRELELRTMELEDGS
jgi:hydrogenase nickel incorporation protein HypA/HybF